MKDLHFIREKEFGKLSNNERSPEFNIVNWNGYKKYDLRFWGDDETPYNGITINENELEELLKVLIKAMSAETSSIPIAYTRFCKIYNDFGTFGTRKSFEKKVSYVNFGYGDKYDIRGWSKDYNECTKGVCFTKEEGLKLIEILKKELKIEPRECEVFFEDFVVTSYSSSIFDDYTVEEIRASISIVTKNGEIINSIIPAYYCKNYNLFFVFELNFINLRKFGTPLCQIITENEFREKGVKALTKPKLNAESKLHILGYNVGSKAGVAKKERQRILKSALENHILRKDEICSHISWLIKNAKKQTTKDMSNAISKWEEDFEYISNYNIDEKKIYGVRTLKIKNNITR